MRSDMSSKRISVAGVLCSLDCVRGKDRDRPGRRLFFTI